MGSARRAKPAKLGDKLFTVREMLGMSLSKMAVALSDEEARVLRTDVYKFEQGEREPSLIILLRYAKLSRVPMEVFADDKLDLPRI